MNPSILYVHDLLFLYDKSSTYSSTGMPESYFARFIDSGCKRVQIISRAERYSDDIGQGYSAFENSKINICKWCTKSYFSLFRLFYIKTFIQEINKSDLLVVNIPSITGMFALILNLYCKKPYSVEVAADYDQFSSKSFGFVVSFFMKPLMSYFCRKAEGGIYVSRYLSEKFATDGVSLVSSNVNIHRVKYRNELRQPMDKNNEIRIGFVGGLNSRKGLIDLLYSIKALKNLGYSRLCLDVIGGHEDRDWDTIINELAISDIVTLHGLRDRKYIDDILESLDLYIQPSLTEGIPRATLEAMSFSTPVVATKLPGFQEILSTDVLINPSNAEELTAMIKNLLDNKDFYNKQITNNYSVASKFSYSVLQNNRVSYYQRVFNRINDI